MLEKEIDKISTHIWLHKAVIANAKMGWIFECMGIS